MHAISSYRGNRHRPPARRPPARHKQDRLQYTSPLCLARSVNIVSCFFMTHYVDKQAFKFTIQTNPENYIVAVIDQQALIRGNYIPVIEISGAF